MAQFVQQVLNGTATGAGIVLASLGLNLIFGVVRIVNFAQGAFYVLGGYLTYTGMTWLGMSYWLALVFSLVVVAAFSAALDPLLFRLLRGKGEVPTIIVTFGLGLVLQEVTRLIWGPSPLPFNTPIVGSVARVGTLFINYQLVAVFAGAAVLIAGYAVLMRKSWFGLQARSLADDPFAARVTGVRVNRVSAGAWAISGGLTAVAGSLILPMNTLQPTVGVSVSMLSFAVVIVGGIGSITGTIIAGLAIGIIQSLIEGYVATGVDDVVAFGALIIVLMLRPQGIMAVRR
jgi:branched-chain amino acid transport system permease protein